jgi:integrase
MTSPTTHIPAPGAAPPFAGAVICDLAGFTLPPGVHGPRFEHDRWDFREVIGLATYLRPHALRVDFTAITNPAWRTLAKEYAVAMLVPDHDAVRVLPGARRYPMSIPTVMARLVELTRWLNWLTAHRVSRLGQVTDWHCEAFLNHRGHHNPGSDVTGGDSPARSASPGPMSSRTNSRHSAATVVLDLHAYRELFTTDRYPAWLRPFGNRPATVVSGRPRPGANTTPVVDPQVLQPLLAGCLYLVTTIGPHVCAELARVRTDRARAYALPSNRGTDPTLIAAALHEEIRQGRALQRVPGWEIRRRLREGWAADDPILPVSLGALARLIGQRTFYPKWLPLLRPVIEQAVTAVGVQESYGRAAALVDRADGTGRIPWTMPLPEKDFRDLTLHLRAACIVVITAVSGMRTSEVCELQVGCCPPAQSKTPGAVRYRLLGRLIKDQPLGGVPDQWVVTQEVHHAAGIAEQLLDNPQPGASLFGRFGFGSINSHLRGWINGPAGQRLGLAPIPAGAVNGRMLRRTLAVELAYRPGGLLAAKIQLKHVSVATTEGYAARPGGAQARFLAEVSAEEQQRNLDLVWREYRNYQRGIHPAGPGARDLVAFFGSVDRHVTDADRRAPDVRDSDQQIRTLLAKRAATLHLGVANYCWFTDPAKALCLKLAGTPSATQPLAGMCDSARCPQATHHPCHRPVWADHITHTTTFLGGLGRGQKTERDRLHAQLARAQKIVAAIDTAAAPAAQDIP